MKTFLIFSLNFVVYKAKGNKAQYYFHTFNLPEFYCLISLTVYVVRNAAALTFLQCDKNLLIIDHSVPHRNKHFTITHHLAFKNVRQSLSKYAMLDVHDHTSFTVIFLTSFASAETNQLLERVFVQTDFDRFIKVNNKFVFYACLLGLIGSIV